MKLKSVKVENYRALEKLELQLDPSLTVLHGDNGYGKTSVLSAIAVGLRDMFRSFPCEPGIDFCEEDRRESKGDPRVLLAPVEGTVSEWKGNRKDADREEKERLALQGAVEEALVDISHADQNDLPIFAFYGTDRTVAGVPQSVLSPSNSQHRVPRLAALEGALSARTDFEGLFTWFYSKEDEELRQQKERRDFNFQLKELDAVRQAISSMLPEVSDPRTELNPPRFVVSRKSGQEQVEKLSLDQLSGGYRIVLALAADLARRMAQGNPHLKDPLASEAVVLIDEVELHLHPGWQQRILDDLRRTFPNAQYIVSTHSPQVLTTVEPKSIVELYPDGDRIVAGAPRGATYGAEAGDVLSVVMRVGERPPRNAFTEALDEYRCLIREGKGESEEALALRARLEGMSPLDPALNRANLEIKRRKLFK